MKVLVAMSGGVDSSVAAARIKSQGHEVVGIHLALSSNPETLRAGSRGCCSLEDSADARRVADKLGIPFYVWDFSDQFKEAVIDDFVDSYAKGETPNPCMRCNQQIKFSALADKAKSLGYDAIATGHYARLENGELRRAVDPKKDQSYVLSVLDPDKLAMSMFPIGDTPKPQIREEAEALGLRVAKKPDSHDICFIPTGKTQVFLGNKIGMRPGIVIDKVTNRKVADHNGIHEFTIGQRKGIGLPGPLEDGLPRFVTKINSEDNSIEIGTKEYLKVNTIWAREPIILAKEYLDKEFECQIQIRAHGEIVEAQAKLSNNEIIVELKEPIEGVAKGQTIVLYSPNPEFGDRVLVSGTISNTEN